MADLKEFSRRIRTIAVQVETGVGAVVRKCALAVDQAVVLDTPVDEGRARSNWIARIDSPAREIREPFAPGKKGSTGGANAAASIQEASAVIAGFDVVRNRSIYVSNNLKYIEPLNQGHSAQAPAGFVERAVQAGSQAVQGATVLGSTVE